MNFSGNHVDSRRQMGAVLGGEHRVFYYRHVWRNTVRNTNNDQTFSRARRYRRLHRVDERIRSEGIARVKNNFAVLQRGRRINERLKSRILGV